jgi:ssDNA-binding Zn-finger/Zn-ribbon topoisomerase 1
MMSCDCDFEPSTVWRDERRKAAKDHVCNDCGGKIVKGEHYQNLASLYDGHWSMSKRCPDCQFLIHEVERTFLEKCGGSWCVYAGDLPESWSELCDGAECADVPKLVRIVGMQRAVCKERGGNRFWSLPSWVEPDVDDQ